MVPTGSVTRGEIVLPNDRMTPTARLQVYSGGYFTRLKEVLETDYKVLLRAMGDHSFFHLALDYVDRHPSRHPNLNRFGKQLPDFIATRRDLANRAFLRDLARPWDDTYGGHDDVVTARQSAPRKARPRMTGSRRSG